MGVDAMKDILRERGTRFLFEDFDDFLNPNMKPPDPLHVSMWGDVLGQWLGSVTARRERMCVAYGAALRACGSERFPNT